MGKKITYRSKNISQLQNPNPYSGLQQKTFQQQSSQIKSCQKPSLHDLDDDQPQYFPFEYKPAKLLSLVLIKLIPPKSTIKLDLFSNKISGLRNDCLTFILKVQQVLKENKLKKAQSFSKKLNIQSAKKYIRVNSQINCQIFDQPTVISALNLLMTTYKLDIFDLKEKLVSPNGSNIFMWIKIKQQVQFNQIWISLESAIEQDTVQKQIQQSKQTKEVLKPMQQFLPVDSRFADNRRPRTIIHEQVYSTTLFNEQHFRNWIRRSKVIQESDLAFERIANNKIKVVVGSLYSNQVQDMKDKLNIYIKHEKGVVVERTKNMEEKIKAITKKSKELTVTYEEGYIKQSDFNCDVWVLKRRNVFKNKSNNVYRLKKCVFWVTGLLSLVKEEEDNIINLMSIMKEDTIDQRFITIKNVTEFFLQDKRIQSIVQDATKEEYKKFKEMCNLEQIKFVNKNLCLKIRIKAENIQKYEMSKKIIEESIKNSIFLQQYKIQSKQQNEYFLDLRQRFILIKLNEQTMLLISKKQQFSNAVKQIQQSINRINHNIKKEYKAESNIDYYKALNYINNKGCQQIHIKEDDKSFTIQLHGPQFKVQSLFEEMQNSLKAVGSSSLQYSTFFLPQEIKLIQTNRELQNQLFKQYRTTMEILTEYTVAAELLFDTSNITVINERDAFQYIPLHSVLVFRSKEELQMQGSKMIEMFKITAIKSNKKYCEGVCKNRDIDLFYCCLGIKDVFQYLMQKYGIKNKGRQELESFWIKQVKKSNKKLQKIVLFVEKDKDKFFNELLTTLAQYKHKFDILLINIYEDVPLNLSLNGKPRYYIKDSDQEFFFAASGNAKIHNSILKNEKFVILYNEDINLTVLSHSCNLKKKKITHRQSGKDFPIQLHNNNIIFQLNGKKYQMQRQMQTAIMKETLKDSSKDILISLGIYFIDLVNMVQTNMFSGYKRQVLCKQNPIESMLSGEFDLKKGLCKFIFQQENEDNIIPASLLIKKYLQSKLISKVIQIEPQILNSYMNKIQEILNNQQLHSFEIQMPKQILISTYKQSQIYIIEAKIQKLIYKLRNREQLQYPPQWIKQTQQILAVDIPRNTDQFIKIEKQFKLAKIHSLLRIQNKIIYRKYQQELKQIIKLNHGKQVKEMRLFHGTRATPPQIIYADKEQAFNINFSSDRNLLGRGIYFAERAAYSRNYSHRHSDDGCSSMLLCSVIVGQSQKCLAHNSQIRDTDQKDKVNKIKFQSMTDYLNGSNVFVVYKSRRAYPMYLIKYK